jgi:hypothetical protein
MMGLRTKRSNRADDWSILIAVGLAAQVVVGESPPRVGLFCKTIEVTPGCVQIQ